MKSRLLSIIAFTFIFSVAINSRAQEAESPSSAPSSSGRFVNLRIAPLSLLIGMANIDLEFKVADQWTLGPTINFWSFNIEDTFYVGNKFKLSRMAFGARANWSMMGAYQTGLYVSPAVQSVTAEASGTSKTTGTDISAKASGVILTGLVGYHWFWENFNMSLGGGLIVGAQAAKATVVEAGVSREVSVSPPGAGLAFDFMFGYVF